MRNPVFPMALLVALFGCTPRPSRPADPSGLKREAYDACERAYSQCLAGSRGRESSQASAPSRAVTDDRWDFGYGSSPDCNAALKRCYEREATRTGP